MMMKSVPQILQALHDNAARPLEQASSTEPQLYWDHRIAEREKTHIFSQDWVCSGLAADLPNAGDYFTYAIADDPVFCIRDTSGDIKTYANICRHRMMRLLEGSGSASRIVCPYHAWSYDLKGKLVGAPYMKKTENFQRQDICLPEFRTEIYQGWIYITKNPNARSVSELLAPLTEITARYGMQHYVPVLREEHQWKTNWKLLTENFMESYHLPVAHKQTVGAWIALDVSIFPEKNHEYFTYQTFGKSPDATYGVAHPDNTSLKGSWRSTSVMPTVFPTHMYVLAPDHLWYLCLRPRGVNMVDVRFGVAIAPEVNATLEGAARQAWLDELTSFFSHVNTEDREIVEKVYASSRSDLAATGRLSWLERELHDFQKYLSCRLKSDLSEKRLTVDRLERSF